MNHQVQISIQPAVGGFVVTKPVALEGGGLTYEMEVVTTVGKAMRVAKAAVEAFSLVAKSKDEAAE
jgi:hypothetical protein